MTGSDHPQTPSKSQPRADSLDMLRGVALVAMAIFHTGWDLTFLGFSEIAAHPGWMVFARIIASSFLFIAGASLVLSTRAGIRWPSFLRRLGVISAAALAVSVATYIFIGDQFVAFGILHHIAVASLIGLAFIRLPLPVVAAAAIIALMVPVWVTSGDHGYGLTYVLGIAPAAPASVDYVPLFPWLAAGLAGIAAARLALEFDPAGLWLRWRAGNRLSRLLVLMGRWSLAIYLVHQPVILAPLMLAASLKASSTHSLSDPAAKRFQGECRATCEARGRGQQYCVAACLCTQDALKREGLWQQTLNNSLSSEGTSRLQSLARACAPAP